MDSTKIAGKFVHFDAILKKHGSHLKTPLILYTTQHLFFRFNFDQSSTLGKIDENSVSEY